MLSGEMRHLGEHEEGISNSVSTQGYNYCLVVRHLCMSIMLYGLHKIQRYVRISTLDKTEE